MGEDRVMRGSGHWALLLVVASGSAGAGCTVTMYPGPKRPAAETALIQQAGASIESIDWTAAPVGSAFVVLPGVHSMEVKPGPGAEAATVCFLARAGHSYRVAGDGAQVTVTDPADVTMRTYRWRDGQVCARVVAEAEADRRAPRPRTASPAADVPEAAEPTSSPPPSSGAETPDQSQEPPSPPPPRAVARSANDDDDPRTARSTPDSEEPPMRRPRTYRPPPHRIVYHDEPDEPPPRKPELGLIFEWGMGGGGADVAQVEYDDGSSATLSLGDGISVSLGLMWTPIWVGDNLGVGLSGTLGYKGWGVGASNGDISINRFPLTLALHILPRVSLRWFLFARGGIDKELGVSLSASGIAGSGSADLDANLGWFGEGGFYKIIDTEEQRGAWSLTFRYTDLTYVAGGGSASARSFMIFNAFYYNP